MLFTSSKPITPLIWLMTWVIIKKKLKQINTCENLTSRKKNTAPNPSHPVSHPPPHSYPSELSDTRPQLPSPKPGCCQRRPLIKTGVLTNNLPVWPRLKSDTCLSRYTDHRGEVIGLLRETLTSKYVHLLST